MIVPIITVIVSLIVGGILLRGRHWSDYLPGLVFAFLGFTVSWLSGGPIWTMAGGADAIDIAVGSWIAYCIGRGGK